MYLFFDTETNGLPQHFGASMEDVNNWPRMTQLAFILTDKDGNIIEKYEALIKPDGWTIPKEEFFLENNMSTERCEKEGVPVFEALRKYQDALKQAEYKVAHNIGFDDKIVGAELIRAGITKELHKFKKGFCTMRSTTQFCRLPKLSGHRGYKWPKLQELHMKLFQTEFEEAHDALADVGATVDCFFKLKELGVVKI